MFIERATLSVLCAMLLSPSVQAHDDMPVFHAFRLEVDAGENRDNAALLNWNFDGWLGGDHNKLWLKSEGSTVDHNTQTSEYWAMYSRNIDTFWDAQVGIRHDDSPVSTTYFTAGFAGVAPYHLETEAHVFVSDEGDVSFRLREETDFLFSQKLILQPYIECNLYAQDVRQQDVGSGLSDATIGLQLRYEISRKIAPHIEVRYEKLYGKTADIAEALEEPASTSAMSAGIRLLF